MYTEADEKEKKDKEDEQRQTNLRKADPAKLLEDVVRDTVREALDVERAEDNDAQMPAEVGPKDDGQAAQPTSMGEVVDALKKKTTLPPRELGVLAKEETPVAGRRERARAKAKGPAWER